MTLDETLASLPADHELRAVLAAVDAHAIISVTDADGVILYVNQRFCDVSGYRADELLGQTHRVVHSGVHDRSFFTALWQTIQSGQRWQGEICNRRKDGTHYWVESTIAPVHDNSGQIVRYISIRTDITDLKANEDRLRRSQVFANVGSWDWNIQTGELYWSERVAPLFGLPEGVQRISYEGFIDAIHPDDRQMVRGAIRACVAGWADYEVEHRCVWPDGSVRWLLERGDVVRAVDGTPLQMLGIVQDITRRKEFELALRKSEGRLAEAQRIAHLGHWEWDMVKGRLWWSDETFHIFGHEPSDLEPSLEYLYSLVPEAERGELRLAEQRARDSGQLDVVHRIVRPDGSVRTLHERGETYYGEDGTPERMVGTVQDITERTELEARLANKTRLLDALRQALLGFVSDAPFEALSATLLDSLIEITASEYGFIGMIRHDPDGTPYLKTYALTDISWDAESRRLYDETQGRGMEFRNLDTLFGAAIRSGELVVSNAVADDPRRGGLPAGHPPLNAFLGVPVYYGGRMVAMYGLANRPGGYDSAIVEQLELFNASYGVLIHAHEVAQAEAASRAETERARQLAEKASRAKSEFLSAMSHELRTPLNAILGFGQLLSLDATALGDEQRDNVDEILRAGRHLLELINEILDLAKIEAGRLEVSVEPMDIDSVLSECCRLLTPMAEQRGVRLTCGSPYGQTVLGDYTRVKQVALNLMSNAIKYNRPHGEVRLTLTPTDAGRLRIAVHDTGKGLSDEQLGQLFQPFQRLGVERSGVEGTGIGLAISKRLVEAMGGTVGVESEPDKGSCFWFELPLADSEVRPETRPDDDAHPQPVPGQASRRVLYVEDNPANMRLMEQIVGRDPRITLLGAAEPERAIAQAADFRPDLLLLDIHLPRITGLELLSQLRQIPGLAAVPAIAVSANAMESDIRRAREHGFCGYLTKPVDVPSLLALFDEYLFRSP